MSRFKNIICIAGLLLITVIPAMAGAVDLNNPVFSDFNRILFVKAQQGNQVSEHHMCDQYFGFNAWTSSYNGLFILENAFRGTKSVTSILSGKTVANGIYAGQQLLTKNGGFLSPDLDYDGNRIVFSWTEGTKSQTWTQATTYHIFRCNLDGTNLTELTSGTKNDIHPAWMPDGKIIFISDRRGGYGRCHQRPCPTFTLYSMNADGTGIRCLSYHETNEWWPQVDNNGMIVYTRWDYVDRGATHTHSAWITKTDGHNPRQLVLNYTNSGTPEYGLGDIPLMQMQIRPIPNSNKYVAVGAPHHWECYGPIIKIDADIEDDDWQATITRVTTDCAYPESNGGGHRYGSPYALSEAFFLCAYSPTDNDHYQLYVVDSSQNKTALYDDTNRSSQSPIPVRSRTKPMSYWPSTDPGSAVDCTISLVNVYNTTLPFPGGTTITSLRIWEPLAKSTTLATNPRISYESTESDWAGRNIKLMLGTVPVESDGSARFTIPSNRPILFQAVNSSGIAVQSMRSATFAINGQTHIMCAGCHEPRSSAPENTSAVPIAFTHATADSITPDPLLKDDSNNTNPFFSYARYIQPIWDAKCISCHDGSPAPDLRKGTLDGYGWSVSYNALKSYVWLPQKVYNYYGFSDWDRCYPRTVPGDYGAQDSSLYTKLTSAGHNTYLTADELHKVVLWLDSGTGQYYGAYTDTTTQNNGGIVNPLYH